MERGRILILGTNKETTYEIRSMLDSYRFELEIALSPEVGRQVLDTRQMNLILVHSEMLKGEETELLQYLRSNRDRIPLAVMGEAAESLGRAADLPFDVKCFDKPYQTDDVISFIKDL